MTFKSKFTTVSALALILAGTGLSTGQSIAQAAVLGDNYPSQWKYGGGADSWGMYKRQCTSFVAFRLSSANGFTLPGGYGNAITWGGVAKSQGYRVDMTPAVGSVAWFGNGVNGAGSYGHVAWVAEVNGDTVTIEEYNYDAGQGPEKYWKRSFHKSKVSGYIHFKDIGKTTTSQSTTSPTSTSTAQLNTHGTYNFTSRASIKAEPKLSSPELAFYDKGQSVVYDKTLEADGYKWISYIAGSGMRRYIPISPLEKTTTTTTTTGAPSPTTTNTSTKTLASSGTYQFTTRSSIKNEPKQSATEVAFYDKGQSVVYDKTLEADGYKWISYISASGVRRYIAVEPLNTTSTAESSQTAPVSSSQPTSNKTTNTIAVGDVVYFSEAFKVTANVSGGLISSSDLAGGTPTSLNYIDPTPAIETDRNGKKSGDQVLYPGDYFTLPGQYKVSKIDKASNGICIKIGSRDTWVSLSKAKKS